jgi:hypothetical protein
MHPEAESLAQLAEQFQEMRAVAVFPVDRFSLIAAAGDVIAPARSIRGARASPLS